LKSANGKAIVRPEIEKRESRSKSDIYKGKTAE
jgi:hypothetical protein